jgi:DNA-binding protein HU-beta
VNKTEMAQKLAKKTDLTVAKATEVIDVIFSSKSGYGIIAIELDADRDVSVAGFGKFYTSRSKAREGINPATGAKIHIEAKKHAKFKPSKGLKDRVAT